jgi:protoporphyrinogen/coproporphyrinogen III oxidase
MVIDAVVIGGGIAGLTVAYELHRRQVPFIVLERCARAGGLVLSEDIDGYTIDAGPDALLVQKPDGIRLCEELGLKDDLIPTKKPRLSYIQRGGRLHPLADASVLGIPTRLRPFLATRLFSWPGKLRMAGELFVPARRDGEDESIGAFITRRFGREATIYLAEPLLAGIHAGDVNRLSIRSLFPRLVDAERSHGSVLRAFHARRSLGADTEGAFRSLPGGLSQMIRALLASLPAGRVRLNAPVRCVGCNTPSGTFFVETADGDRIQSRTVTFATPAYVTAGLLRPIDVELARLCDGIPYVSTGIVAMAFRRSDVAHPLNGSGFVVPSVEKSGILAGSWMSSKWPHRAPADRVLMRAFVGGARDPRALDRSDAELVDQALAGLRPLLGIGGDPLFTKVYRWERAGAQHEVGHGSRLGAIARLLGQHQGIFLTGSAYRGVGIPDCVADGRATGKQVTAYLTGVHD